MKKNIFITIGIFCCLLTNGQIVYNTRYNFDYVDVGYGVKKSQDGYLITGPIINVDSVIWSGRIQALRIDSAGNIVHHQNYFHLPDWLYPAWYGNLVECENNSFAMLGSIADTVGDSDFFLFKFDYQGDTLWTRRVSDTTYSIARNLCKSNDNGFVLVGQYRVTPGFEDILMIKTDSLGTVQWRTTFNQSDYDDALSVIQTKDNGYLLGGFFRTTPAGFHDVLIIKTDSLGTEEWRKIVGNQYDQSAWDVVETQDSNYVITGGWQTYDHLPHCCESFGYRFFLMKLDKDSGNVMWMKLYDDSITAKGFRSVIELNDGSIVCAGTRDALNGATFGTIFKFSANGDSLWERNYLPPLVVNGFGFLNDIIATSDGGFMAVGNAGGDTLTQDTWILKVDSMGCEVLNCLTTDLQEHNFQEGELLAYPNPANGNQIHLTFNESLKQETLLEVFNTNGELVLQKQIPIGLLDEQLDLTSYANGLYLVRITGKEISLQTKFVVQRN